MKKKIKIITFLLIFVMALSVNVDLDNKHFLNVVIRKIEAEQPWITIAESNIRNYNNRASGPFTYDPIKYKYRIKVYGLSCPVCNAVCVNIETANQPITEICFIDGFTEGKILNVDDLFSQNLLNGHVYRLNWGGTSGYRTCKSCNGEWEAQGYISLSSQLKNTAPVLTLTQPTSNSPLQSIGCGVRGAV